jgi:hypothetical protein
MTNPAEARTTVTPIQAVARARNQSINGPQYETGMCLRATRQLYGVPALYTDAATAWAHTRYRVSAEHAPAGALVWWTGGSAGHGHVAILGKDGYCWSVDIRRPGYFDRIPVATITREWGLTFAGYSLDVNGVQVVPAPPRPTPNLDHGLKGLRAARDRRKPGPIRTAIADLILRTVALRKRVRR